MTLAGRLELAARHQQLVGVLAHGLEQPVARPAQRGLVSGDDRLVDEAGEHVHREPRRHRRRGLGVEGSDEHGQTPERRLLRGLEQLVAPLDRGSHRPVAGRGEPRAAAERAQPRLEIGQDLRRRHDADPRSGELDRQRQTVESLTQRRNRRARLAVWDELGVALPRALHEQPPGILGRQRVQSPYRFAAHPERFAARRQDPQVPTRPQERRRQLRARIDDVLAVVDHQQHVAVGQVAAQRFGRLGRAAAADAEDAGDLGCRVGVCGAGRQIHEPDPIRPSPDLTARDLGGDARLANAARTGQRHETSTAKRLADPAQLARPADQ